MFDHPSEFVTFKASPHLPGVELYSARLVRHAFAAHAHDGYSLGAIEAGATLLGAGVMLGMRVFRGTGPDHGA